MSLKILSHTNNSKLISNSSMAAQKDYHKPQEKKKIWVEMKVL